MKKLAILFLLSLTFQLKAQETVVPLLENPILKSNDQKQRLNVRLTTLELPFFDDFYPSDIYPNTDFWIDDLVYINATFPVNPPTIGVATFDGLNALGAPYSIVVDDFGEADALTSMPINLDGLTEEDDVFLSFFFQPQGLGEAPEFLAGDLSDQDVLLVEFKDTAGVWDTLWSVQGDTNQAFRQIFVRVSEPYLHGDFQMRFKAIGNLTGAFDHWHLDYVRLDRNRDPLIEANIPEMAYQFLPTSLITPYYVMPYHQYDSTYLVDTHSVFIRNNFIQATTDIIDFYTATVQNTGAVLDNYSGPSRDVGPLLSFKEDYQSFEIPTNLTDDTVVVIVDYRFLVSAEDTSNTISIRNNQIVKNQVFGNTIAYDDGTAERGFALKVRSGDAQFGRVAQKYNIKKADTLQAIKVLFTPFIDDVELANNSNLSVFVWQSLETDSTEEVILFQRDNINLNDLPFGDSIKQPNDFTFIPIEAPYILDGSSDLIVQGDFYIGIGVEVGNVLSIGYDLNTTSIDKLFLTLGLNWTQTSQISGSLMMNPVLGKALPEQYISVGLLNNVLNQLKFEIYPNPIQEILSIQSEVKTAEYQILNMVGSVMTSGSWETTQFIDVSALPKGMYVLQLMNNKRTFFGSRQFIKM